MALLTDEQRQELAPASKIVVPVARGWIRVYTLRSYTAEWSTTGINCGFSTRLVQTTNIQFIESAKYGWKFVWGTKHPFAEDFIIAGVDDRNCSGPKEYQIEMAALCQVPTESELLGMMSDVSQQ